MSEKAKLEYENSRKVCEQQVNNIKLHKVDYSFDMEKFKKIKKEFESTRLLKNQEIETDLRNKLSAEQIRALDLSKMKGASSWLTTIPNESISF